MRAVPLLPPTEFFAEDGSKVLLPFGGPRGRGALRQDPPIVRDLYVSLEDLYQGCTKKIKLSRRVGAEGGGSGGELCPHCGTLGIWGWPCPRSLS